MFLTTPTTDRPRVSKHRQQQRRSEEEEEIVVELSDTIKVVFREDWKLAIGQSSTVYRGHLFDQRRDTKKESAVKVAHSDEDSQQAIERERKVMMTWSSFSYAMPLLAYKGRVSVFELAPKTLVRAVEAKEFNLEWVKELFQALVGLHERGVVHGDLKPHNILINSEGKIKLCDFGSAVLLNDEEENFFVGGTTAYTPPEALSADPKQEHSYKRDVYAAGLTSYFMITGRVPFKSHGSPVRLIFAIRQGFMECGDNGVPADLYSHNPPFYDIMMDFWRLCTHKQPELRPTAKQALDALLNFL